MEKEFKQGLEKFALQIRIGILVALKSRGFGHAGGSLSIADTLAVLYGGVMRYDSADPKLETRDRLVCSKGHAGPAVYAALALKGFFPYEELKTLNRPHTILPSHCDKNKTPGVDITTGSLGQGTSQACGVAVGCKLKGLDSKVYLIVGDGELDEGQVWEAAMFAAGKKLNNMVWFIDDNKKQLDGPTAEVMPLLDIRAKFESFGFEAVRVNGNDVEAVHEAITAPMTDKPRAIVLDTVKGFGVKEIAEMAGNHSITPAPEKWDEWLAQLHAELGE